MANWRCATPSKPGALPGGVLPMRMMACALAPCARPIAPHVAESTRPAPLAVKKPSISRAVSLGVSWIASVKRTAS